MTDVPQLERLIGAGRGSLVDILALLCEQLGMGAAVLGQVEGDTHLIQLAVDAGGHRLPDLEGPQSVRRSWCALVPATGLLVVPDTSAAHELAPPDADPGNGCYVGTRVRADDGRELAVLGVVGPKAHATLNERDLDVLTGLAQVIAELWEAGLVSPEAELPAPRRAPDLSGVADVLEHAHDLEGLTRPLLELLHDLSGLASTYLTSIDAEADQQHVRYSRNATPEFVVPEGLVVPWHDTLCRRALDEGRESTADVPALWGDCAPAASMGLQTYASVPVRLSDGRVWGTLCGADDVVHRDVATHLPTLHLFARLIATEVERAAAVDTARERAVLARRDAETDELTGCATRRTVQPWLRAALDGLGAAEVVVLAFVDVDDFKAVNDGWGHAVGDAALRELGGRLLSGARSDDLVARLGGDEFVVAARLPRGAVPGLRARVRGAVELAVSTPAGPLTVRCSTGWSSSDEAADPDGLLQAADAAMYREKGLTRR